MATAEETARKLLDSMRAGDLAAALSTIDERCVIRASEALPWGGEHKGVDGFQGILRTMATLFVIDIHDYEVFETGHAAVVRARTTFTSRASGQSVPMSIVEIYQVHNDRIVEGDIYYKDPHVIGSIAAA